MSVKSQADEAETVMESVVGRIVRRWRPLLAFSLAFSLLETAALAPTAALVLRLALQSWGRCSVGNFEIIAFFLSPVGLLGLAVLIGLQLTTMHLRLAGVMGVLAGDGPGVWHAFDAVKKLPAVLKVDVLQAVLYLLLAVPFAAVGAFAHSRLWGPHDLNRLVVDRPPEFWWGVAALGAVVGLYAIAAAGLYVRWLFAVPAVLFEDVRTPWAALRSSAKRTSGRIVRLAMLVAILLGASSAAWFATTWTLGALNGFVLDHVGHGPRRAVAATAGLLAFDGAMLGGLSMIVGAIFAAVVMNGYKRAGGVIRETTVSEPKARWWTTAATAISAAALVPAALTASELVSYIPLTSGVEITAHRAGAFGGPENTIAALKVAAEAGAEWAEIDVQTTADDQIVVIHDDDLLRVGGSPLRVASSTLEQLREVDLGARFAPAFAGERIATLDEYLDAAALLPIRLNIELKTKTDAQAIALAGRVVEALRRSGRLARDRICGQSNRAIAEVRRLAPEVQVGFISGAVIGDPTRLDVDFLMMEARLATRTFVDRARRRGVAVHAWTVNVVDRVGPLVDDGVVNIITDDVPGVRARLDEIAALDPLERLLLRVRNGLAER